MYVCTYIHNAQSTGAHKTLSQKSIVPVHVPCLLAPEKCYVAKM